MTRFGMATARSGLLSLGCVALPAIAGAQGCGPTRLKVSESVTLDLPPAKVWAMVGDFQNMSWDPRVLTTVGSGGDVVDHAVRTITLANGVVFGDSLYKYDVEARSYSYHIDKIDVDRLPVQNVSATLDVVPEDGGARSKMVWRAAFYRYLKQGEGAPDIADSEAVKAMAGYLRSGLDGLKARLEANKLAPKT